MMFIHEDWTELTIKSTGETPIEQDTEHEPVNEYDI